MRDVRSLSRKRTFLAAYGHPGPGREALPCLVRDLSQRGARIMIAGAESLPETFDLYINGRDRLMRVKIVWRTATEIGVSLTAKLPFYAIEETSPNIRCGS